MCKVYAGHESAGEHITDGSIQELPWSQSAIGLVAWPRKMPVPFDTLVRIRWHVGRSSLHHRRMSRPLSVSGRQFIPQRWRRASTASSRDWGNAQSRYRSSPIAASRRTDFAAMDTLLRYFSRELETKLSVNDLLCWEAGSE